MDIEQNNSPYSRILLILTVACFLIVFAVLFTKNKYYLPETIKLAVSCDASTKLNIQWDSGSGYNNREAENVDCPYGKTAAIHKIEYSAGGPSGEGHEHEVPVDGIIPAITVQLPQYRIYSIRGTVTDDRSKMNISGAALLQGSSEKALSVTVGDTGNKFVISEVQQSRTTGTKGVLIAIQSIAALIVAAVFNILFKNIIRLKRKNISPAGILKSIFIDEKRGIFWAAFSSSIIIYSLWLAGQWPGVMTIDSLESWDQIKSFNLNNHHPYIYTLYIMFLTQFYDNIVSVGMFQILAMSTIVSLFTLFVCRNVAWYFVLPFIICLVLSPVIGIYNITIWKDIPYSMAVLAFALIFYYLCYRKKIGNPVVLNENSILMLALGLVFLCTVRHNGIVFIVFIPLLLVVLGLMDRFRLIRFTVYTIALILIVNYVVPCAIQVKHNKIRSGLNWKMNSIAAFFHKGIYSPDYKKDLEVVGKAIDPDVFKNNYSPGYVDFIYDKSANLNISESEYRDINNFYYRTILNNIPVFVTDRVEIFSKMLGYGFLTENLLNADPEMIAFLLNSRMNVYKPKINSLGNPERKLLDYISINTGRFSGRQLFANSEYALFLLIISILIYGWLPMTAVFSLVVIYQVPFLFLTIPMVDFRFGYSIYMAGFFVIPLALLEVRTRRRMADEFKKKLNSPKP